MHKMTDIHAAYAILQQCQDISDIKKTAAKRLRENLLSKKV